MNRNLITRMGAASGVVAALVAVVFVLLVQAVREVDGANQRASDAERIVVAAAAVRTASTDDRGQRLRALTALVANDRELLRELATSDGSEPDVDAVVRAAALEEREQREKADDAIERAVWLGVGGLIGSTLLILTLTWYLARYIVVPLRRVAYAASQVARGDLTVRVAEAGDSEPVELARSFNTMAANLQRTQAETEHALEQLAAEKRRIEVYNRVSERLAQAPGLEALAQVALRELADATGAEVGALWTSDPQAGDPDVAPLRLAVVEGLDPAELQPQLRAGHGHAGAALAQQRMLVVGPEGADEDDDASPAPRAEVHVPLVLGGQTVGVLSLARLDAHPFAPSDLAMLERLAKSAAVALGNALSFRRAVRNAQVAEAIINAVPDPLGLVAADGTLLAENDAMAALRATGFEPDTPGDDVGREIRDEVTTGDRTYLRYAAPVLDHGDRAIGRLVVLRDVTAERQTERMKDEFFALVSHELRTPLTSIIGYLELVSDDEEDLPEDTRRFLEVVDRNANRLLRLVGDMLFIAQVEAGRLSLERSDVDLRSVVADAVVAARPAAERGTVELVLDADPAAVTVVGDRDRLGQMIDNLVSNALKFTPEGGRVTVRLRQDREQGEISVTDTGMGIPGSEQARLFERFFRSSKATLKAVPGAGLGLTIVKTIVEAHGGTIALTSTEGEGTAVTIRLPLSPAMVTA